MHQISAHNDKGLYSASVLFARRVWTESRSEHSLLTRLDIEQGQSCSVLDAE